MKLFLPLVIFFFFNASGFAEKRGDLVRLLGFAYDQQGITFQVPSGGCTDKDTVNLGLLESESFSAQLELRIKTPDLCEAPFPYGVKLTYTYEELGLNRGDQLMINNLNAARNPAYSVLGVLYDGKGITYQVKDSGCTSKKDFTISVQKSIPPGIILERIKGDPCRGHFPYGRKILFTYEELGLKKGQPFTLENNIVPGNGGVITIE